MSNRLSIEVAEIILRSSGESEDQIFVFDDEDTIHLNVETVIPDEPEELLKMVCRLSLAGMGHKLEGILDFHIIEADDEDGIDIEGDWIELNDPRISEIVKAYRKQDRKFFGLAEREGIPLGPPETADGILANFGDSKPIQSAHGLEIGDSVIVPDPKPEDSWDHEFTGTIKRFRNEGIATVLDQEDNAFDVEINRLKKDEE